MIISLYKSLHICYIFILLTDFLPLTGFTIILSYCGVIINPQVHPSFCFDCVGVVSSLGYSRTELRYIHKLSLTDWAWMHLVNIRQLFQSQVLPSQSKEICENHIKLNYRSTLFERKPKNWQYKNSIQTWVKTTAINLLWETKSIPAKGSGKTFHSCLNFSFQSPNIWMIIHL